MEAKCITSIKVPQTGGKFLVFVAGTVYDVKELDKATIKANFESPELSPPIMQTRERKAG